MRKKILPFTVLFIGQTLWIVSKGYRLYHYNPATGIKSLWAKLDDKYNSSLASIRLTRRLFRAEITHLYHFQHDTWMCIAKKAIFKYNKERNIFEKCHEVEKGSRPMNLCQSDNGTIYFGEYCNNPNRQPMRIFMTKDNGTTWQVAYTFQNGEINHIHGIFRDPYSNKIWVATGDHDECCVFGYTEDGFKTFVRQYEGSQQYRVCVPLFTENEIIFATDSQYEQNYIRSIDRQTGLITNITPIQGSGIYAVQNGKLMMVSTTVEPSTVNKDIYSHLWYSLDGRQWKELMAYQKDIWDKKYFQFGSIRFPDYEVQSNYIVFSGRALKKIDGKSVIIHISDLE